MHRPLADLRIDVVPQGLLGLLGVSGAPTGSARFDPRRPNRLDSEAHCELPALLLAFRSLDAFQFTPLSVRGKLLLRDGVEPLSERPAGIVACVSSCLDAHIWVLAEHDRTHLAVALPAEFP